MNWSIATSRHAPRTWSNCRVAARSRSTPRKSKRSSVKVAAEIKYDQTRDNYADTVEGQWKLAEWCRENRLPKQRKTHLERVVELDPEHAAARHALGYSHIQGRWVTQAKLMTENGYVRYKGAWVLPQEIEILEEKGKEKQAAARMVEKA